jgi:predicted SpoU family rRNA methylase
MRELKRMQERYLRDERLVRMGNLASSLLRLSHWVRAREKDEAIINLMREVAWFMEWNGDFASPELVDMQREICRWRRIWPVEKARAILALRAHQMSNRILELSGLVKLPGKE